MGLQNTTHLQYDFLVRYSQSPTFSHNPAGPLLRIHGSRPSLTTRTCESFLPTNIGYLRGAGLSRTTLDSALAVVHPAPDTPVPGTELVVVSDCMDYHCWWRLSRRLSSPFGALSAMPVLFNSVIKFVSHKYSETDPVCQALLLAVFPVTRLPCLARCSLSGSIMNGSGS